jgi:uncharacterized protein (DUF1697 family)
MKKHSIAELNKLYNDSEQVDQDLFSEQRTNILLTLGNHYSKKGSKYWSRIREARNLSEEQKVRITRNHIQKVVKSYINNIISHAPGVQPVPKNEKENQDVKAAQLNDSVWRDVGDRFTMREQVYEDAQDFISIGEVAMKIFWDENAGRFLGWEQQVDETGQPMIDENGEPVNSGKPVFAGDFVFERIYGFNLLRAKESKNMKTNDLWIVRKMADVEEIKAKLPKDDERQKFVQASADKTYVVFDSHNGAMSKESKDQVLIKEFYFKPCYKYPNGYYYIATEGGILFEGELPGGLFPIIYTGFDTAQTTPRGYSIIKQVRPLQVEINRAASKMVEHQISMGDDKLLHQAGAKISAGASLPGIRGVQYTGMKPEVLPGRTGEQYLPYITSVIDELYNLANVKEDNEEVLKQADPLGMLFFSMRDKKKFSIYAEKFERYQIQKCNLVLSLAKLYYNEDMLIPAIGRHEIVNIAEFKNTNPLSYEIKLKSQNNDIETMFGRQVVMNHALQYVGNQLGKEDIGRIIRNMPFGNFDESFSDLTMDYDMATNMILALDRGEQPNVSPYDTHQYMLKRLIHRMRQSDFNLLDPMIQENYKATVQLYEMQEAQQQQKIAEAQAGFIPSGGARVKVDYYVADPSNPAKVSRATLPAEAVDWLIRRLGEQGSSQESLKTQTQGAVSDIAQLFLGNGKQQQQQQQQPLTQGEVPSATQYSKAELAM